MIPDIGEIIVDITTIASWILVAGIVFFLWKLWQSIK